MTRGRFAVMAAIAIVAYQFLPDAGWWTTIWQVTLGWAAAGAVVLGARRQARGDRTPWWFFAAGIFSNVAGIAVAHVSEAWWGLVDLPTPADPFFLMLYPAFAIGLALLIRRRDEWRNWTALVDATTITTGFGLLAWVYVIDPVNVAAQMSRLAHATQVAYPIGDLLLIAMMTRLLRGGGNRGPSLWWTSGALVALLIGDSAWVVMDNMGTTGLMLEDSPWVGRLVESVFLTAFCCVAVAALDPSAARLAQPAAERSARLGPGLLALLTGASLIAPGLLAVQLHRGSVDNGWSIVIGSTALFLLVVARMAGLIREVERQARQVRELARSDELTGLPNRRAWNDELPRALERARRDHEPVAVAIVDLDHFKRFNDAYGHPAGDRLLKAASAAWHGTLRKVDLIARYGGEEFVVLLPGADAAHGHEALTRMLGATPQGQTFSAGLAVWDGEETSDELLQRADRALYAAKEHGRNRIEMPAAA
ncbi:GGDEF domain-containing protein [Actinoplanes cyaneus]|nr:GGDEF domain-containing protein [Actinoplanes cyaneus]